MARSWRIRYAGAKYHITVRGNARRVVFHEPGDYERFLDQLDDATEKDGVILYAYALLSNHLLVTAATETRISEMMDALEGDFAQYYTTPKPPNSPRYP